MSLFSRIRGHFRPPTPTDFSVTLRNKPNGLAFVKGLTDLTELNGRVVRTIRIEGGTSWAIDPIQSVRNIPAGIRFTNGRVSKGGERGDVTAIADDCLQPINDPGEDAKDETLLWLPVPNKQTEAA